jgi:3-(3-hydroxy-phenyl)propionate hydroxylase
MHIEGTFFMRDTPTNPQPGATKGYRDSEAVSVVIVGAGPTGLTAGNLLGMAGIDTLILERNASVSNHPKAISLDDEGLRICQAIDLGDAVSKCILADIHAHYVSAGRFLAKVSPTSKRNGHPLISTFNQPEFEATLLEGLKRFECVNVRFQSSVVSFEQTDSKVIVTIRSPTGELQTVVCSYLLSCDGGRSTIRDILNIPMRGTTFAQKWLVVDVRTDEKPAPIAFFFCNPKRPAVTVPSPRNGRRWEFMLLPGEAENDLLKDENIAALIEQAGGSHHSRIIRKTVYTFHSMLAKNFSKGRVFLLGDAAHMMPPFGGQGLNSGLRDAHNLIWKLAMVLRGSGNDHLLDTYHEERHRHVAQMIRFSSFLGTIAMSTKGSVAYCRDIAIELLNRLPAVRVFVTEARLKPQPRYKAGFFLFCGRNKNSAMIGQMLPQPMVTTTQGHRILLDEALGTGFALLRLHHNPEDAFAGLKTDFWERLGARFVCIQPSRQEEHNAIYGELSQQGGYEPPGSGMQPVVVVQADDTGFLGNNQDLFFVIRPDRYILGVFREKKADVFVSAFQGLLQKHW